MTISPVADSLSSNPACPPARWLQPLLAFIISYLWLLVAAINPKFASTRFEPDTLWHVANGQWMLDHGEILKQDVFSHTFTGQRWITLDWLSEILMALVYRLGGWDGLFLATSLVFSLTLAVFAARLQRYLAPYFVMVFTFLAFQMCLPFSARPQVFTWILLVVWVSNLTDAVDRDQAPSFWNVPLMTLWANMHGGFVVGLALMGLLMIEPLVSRLMARRWRDPVLHRWLLFALGSVAASLLTPNGFDLHQHIATVMLSDRLPIKLIQEWGSWQFQHLNWMGIWILLIFGTCLLQGIRVPPFRALVFLAVFYAALSHMRNVNLVALLPPILLARVLAAHWVNRPLNGIDRFIYRIRPERQAATYIVALAILLAASVLHHQRYPIEPDEKTTAKMAIDAVLAQGIKGPVFNTYNIGGSLIFRGIPTYIDGRSNLYGGQYLKDYLKIQYLTSLEAVTRFVSDCRIGWTLLPVDAPLAVHLETVSGWRRIHRDEKYVVHVNEHCQSSQ